MRFFTPELFVRFNSDDLDEAFAADEAWDEADARYQLHLDATDPSLPAVLRDFHRNVCLHDADHNAPTSAPDQFRRELIEPLLQRVGAPWASSSA